MDSPATQRPVLAVVWHFFHFLGSAVFAFAVAVIPKFAAIYRDMLGPGPLPPLTLLALRFQPLWIALAIVFLLAALYVVWYWRLRPVPDGISVVFLLLPVALVTLLLVALFRPLIGTIVRQKQADSLVQSAR
jgi:type II secretory pathway component PulF